MNRIAARLPGLLLLGVALYYAVWGGEYSMPDLHRLRGERHAEEKRLAQVQAEADSLQRVADALERDPATIEAVARERFGMIAPGEVLYRFVQLGPTPGDSALAAATP